MHRNVPQLSLIKNLNCSLLVPHTHTKTPDNDAIFFHNHFSRTFCDMGWQQTSILPTEEKKEREREGTGRVGCHVICGYHNEQWEALPKVDVGNHFKTSCTFNKIHEDNPSNEVNNESNQSTRSECMCSKEIRKYLLLVLHCNQSPTNWSCNTPTTTISTFEILGRILIKITLIIYNSLHKHC